MTVFVDDMHELPMGRLGRMRMCHMMADTRAELLDMADRIGVARRWIQYPDDPVRVHFDISMGKRALAVEHGAVEITVREMARMRAARRDHVERAVGAEAT